LGLTDAVRIHPWVPHEESLRLQGTADVLLLPMWNHPSEIGVFTGKLFEYVGSRRPILAITSPANVAARLIRARRLGFAGTDPAEIAAQLQRWSDQKEREGQIRDLPASSTKGLTRQDQTRNLETFLEGIVRATTSSEEYRRPGPRE
jgi:hypothetical protein